ncbi:MAG: zinc dependent phospholipase C family protein [Tissierellaceae bacterium]|nr:zinc dependent phospholipase C family protein [Tissierellaceae bacterium]
MATNIYNNVFDIYGLKLDKDRLLWGSVAPDVLPHYKFIRHYADESINYITKEIIKIIFVSRYVDFKKIDDPISIKLLSKKIGIISHYLSDYVCYPHANRWTFFGSMKKHIKYESDLNDYARTHSFKKNVVQIEDIDIYDDRFNSLKSRIKDYIHDVISEYNQRTSLDNDLNFAISLNLKMTYFILDTINQYSEELYTQFVFEI